MTTKPTYLIDGDMPPLAETGQSSLLDSNQSVGSYKGADGQIYAQSALPGGSSAGTSVSSGTLQVEAQDLVQEGESINITAWFGKSWVKWGAAGMLAGAAGHYGYQAWKKSR